MPVLFNGYCHADVEGAARAAWGLTFWPVNNGVIQDAIGFPPNELEVFFTAGGSQTLFLLECDRVGSWPPDLTNEIDPELIQLGALGMLSMWGIGLGIGIIISVLRKMRNT